MKPIEHPQLRGVVTASLGGQSVRVPVCQCGELLIGAHPDEGIRCRYRECEVWYSAREIEAAMRAAEPSTTQDAA